MFNLVRTRRLSTRRGPMAELTASGAQSVQQSIVEQAQRLLALHTVRDHIVQPTFLRA